MKKTRYNNTLFYFVITDINGKFITISAADGTIKTIISTRIIPLKSNEISVKQAKTIPGISRGSIVEIISYNAKKDTNKVKFEVDGDDDYIDIISDKQLHVNKPLMVSQLELEYFDNKNK
jgi:hypothetical protein